MDVQLSGPTETASGHTLYVLFLFRKIKVSSPLCYSYLDGHRSFVTLIETFNVQTAGMRHIHFDLLDVKEKN